MTDLLTPALVGSPDEPTPIDVYLRMQQDLSAVERFAAHHDACAEFDVTPAQSRWRDRLPATPPGPGQQYAFEVDLDSCTGCKACVAACHNLNGLDDDEDWRRVGMLHDTGGAAGGSITVTSACHHCVDPACLNGCPAQAYEKDPVTGIVRHLDDACIGCSYCTLTCPYEVPVFNESIGIVRKCDLCADRLAEGEAPACVQGCPQGAITIGLVSVDALLDLHVGADADPSLALVPSAPPSHLTVPSTTYRTTKPVSPSWEATDRSSIHPSAGHSPLAVMLVLTQAAVGMTVAAAVLHGTTRLPGAAADVLTLVGLVTGLVALAASTLHLGRPRLAWRAVLGLRRSWLSREIVAFGLFAGAGVAHGALRVADAPGLLVGGAEAAAAFGGLAGVACSIRVYSVTGRRWWRTRVTASRFGGTLMTTGAVGTAAILALVEPETTAPLLRALLGVGVLGLVVSVLAPLVPLWLARGTATHSDLHGTTGLLRRQLRPRHHRRLAAAAVGAGLLVVAAGSSASGPAGSATTGIVLVLAWLAIVFGEHQERRLFFLASVAPRMPGSPR